MPRGSCQVAALPKYSTAGIETIIYYYIIPVIIIIIIIIIIDLSLLHFLSSAFVIYYD